MIIGKIMYNNLNHFVRQKVSILTQKELGTPHDVDWNLHHKSLMWSEKTVFSFWAIHRYIM